MIYAQRDGKYFTMIMHGVFGHCSKGLGFGVTQPAYLDQEVLQDVLFPTMNGFYERTSEERLISRALSHPSIIHST